MKWIILDTDPGVDNTLAFLLAFSSPEISVETATTVDSYVSPKQGDVNAKKLLEFLGRTYIPNACGAKRPLVRLREHASAFYGKIARVSPSLISGTTLRQ